MSEITIRRVEDSWLEKVREEAERRRISKNDVLVEALGKGLGIDDRPTRPGNLDKYAGDSDFGPEWDEFLEGELKRVDERLWKTS